jgi:hypothetical protein
MDKHTFIKEMGWDDPEYGWTKEKELLNDLLQSERKKCYQEMVGMIDKIFKDNSVNGMYSPDGVAESLSQLNQQLDKKCPDLSK